MKKRIWIRWGSVLVLSFLVLLVFAARTSPVYSLLLGDYGSNRASAAMIIGKCWAEGTALPYRDLFSMGGPLYFLLQAFGWFLAGRTGIFLLEGISFFLFLGFTGQIAARFVSGKWTAVCILLCAVVYPALCAAGDSSFEWCLPFVAGGLAVALRPGWTFRNRDAVLTGLLCGCVLLIDFRGGGLLYGAAPWIVFFSSRGQHARIWKRFLSCLTGVAIPVLVAALAFLAAGDLTGMLQGTFLYPACALLSGFDSLQVVFHKGAKCLFLLPMLAGGIVLLAREKRANSPGVCVLLGSFVCGLFLLCGDNRWYYYLAALPAVPIGISLLCAQKKKIHWIAGVGIGFVLALGISVIPAKNYFLFLREGIPEVIEEFYEDAQSYQTENPDWEYLALDTDYSSFLLLDKMPDYRYFTDQTELASYDSTVEEIVEEYISDGSADILFITERGYIGRDFDQYYLTQVYLKYGGSLFVYVLDR